MSAPPTISRFLARELAHPSAILGPTILAPLWNRRNAALNDTAFEALAVSPEDHVLEIGFGGGYLLGRLGSRAPRGLVAGVDASPSMVAYVSRREKRRIAEGQLVLRCASAEALPFADDSFSKLCSVNSLFYWQNPDQALAELRRVAAPDARLVLCFTDRNSLARKSFSRHGLGLYTKADIQLMLERAAWRVVAAQACEDRHRQFWCLTALR
ncbi:MAG: methyltransferase domain-containing protein [Anaerolineales bacterium]|jgi:ubiquinone/menaquinone biosynthesis C-methylase UbiE